MIFIKIFQNLGQFSGKVPLEHWVSRVAVNTCLSQIESERVRPELRHADLSEEEQAVIENLATSSEDLAPDRQLGSRQLVEHLLEMLKPAERLVIDLLYLQGRSVEEIHRITGLGVAAIKVRAFRARQKMKAQLEKIGATP
jgi:RNA polymerase sigma-70 factor (ECF subfamily)